MANVLANGNVLARTNTLQRQQIANALASGRIAGMGPEGRWMYRNPDGSVSTERTMTVLDPRLNSGHPTNIPSMYNGYQMGEPEAIERTVRAGGVDPETGRQLPGYLDIQAAEDAARARSQQIGQRMQERQRLAEQMTHTTGQSAGGGMTEAKQRMGLIPRSLGYTTIGGEPVGDSFSGMLTKMADAMGKGQFEVGGMSIDPLDFVNPVGGMAKLTKGPVDELIMRYGDGPAMSVRQPWEMTRAEYNAPMPKAEMESIYLPIGRQQLEVVRNPTISDIGAMKKEARRKYPNLGPDEPVLRRTEDEAGNVYYWNAYDAVHDQVENILSSRVGMAVNQNAAQKTPHRNVIRRALMEGKKVPKRVLDEYPELSQ